MQKDTKSVFKTLFNNDEHIEKEIRETTLFTIVLVKKNGIEINLSWQNNENIKTLLEKKMNKTLEDLPFSWIN